VSDHPTVSRALDKDAEDAEPLIRNELPFKDEGALQAWNNSLFHWPKDRTIFNRLENICICVENGEWPVAQRYMLPTSLAAGVESHSSTPLPGTPTQSCPTPTTSFTPVSAVSGGLDLSVVAAALSNANASAELQLSESLALALQKRRHRRTKAEMEADRGKSEFL